MIDPLAFNLAIALAIGLLIGAERERRKTEGSDRSPAGIRTFAITALLGAVSIHLGGETLLATTGFGLAVLLAVAYWRNLEQDPGLTTEMALLLTLALGGLAMRRPELASGLAVTVTILLLARSPIHHFVRSVLSEGEVRDAVVFAAAVLVVLPLTPDRYLGPFAALNPRTVWTIVILVMAISALGYIAVRLLGPRVGLPLTGLASGFVSSAATIASMGARAVQEPALERLAVAGAVLSSVATLIQMALVLAATSPATLAALALPLLCAGLVALLYGAVFTIQSLRRQGPVTLTLGRAFNLKLAVLFAATIALVLLASAALNAWLGRAGLLAATAISGFADTHAPAVAVASLVAAGKLSASDAVVPILAGLASNTLTKIVLACGGGRRFALRVIPGLLLIIAAAWLATWPALAADGAILDPL